MMVDKDDLGLSLSLRCSTTAPTTTNHGRAPTASSDLQQLRNRSTFPMNLMPPSPLFASSSSNSSSSSSLPLANLPFNPAAAVQRPSPWLDCFPSSDRTGGGGGAVAVSSGGAGDPRSFLRGIDVNRPPVSVADDEEPGASSPNSTISSLSGKRSEREVVVIDVSAGEDLDIACTRGNSDEEDADACRKKLRLSKDQSAVLEDSFKEHNTLNPKQKLALAKKLGLRPRQVEVWFQNRRARTKLKQTEVDCEFLKRCCEQMTEENRRLQKEVQELRALKLSPQFYMQMTPPTTLTMCPSCERVSPPTSSSGSASAASAAVQHRGMAMNPWGLAPGGGPFRSFEGLRGRP